MGQLQQLSDSLERARSQYDSANAQLARIQHDLRENRHELRIAKSNLHQSQRTIAKRLVTLYTTDQASTLEVILGAKNLDDMINRMDSAKSVTALDTRILSQVKTFRTAVKRHGTLLANARASQARVVAERAAAKHSIESKINEQNNLLSSLKGATFSPAARLPAAAFDHRRRCLGDRSRGGNRRCAAADAQQRRQHRDVAARNAVRLGRVCAGRIRLLRPRHVGVCPGRRLAPALLVCAVRLRRSRLT